MTPPVTFTRTRHRPGRTRTAVVATVVCLLVSLLTAAIAPGPAAVAAATAQQQNRRCPVGQGPEATDLSGVSGDRQPVILVHGWTGGPLWDTRTKLEELPSGVKRQYFLFDYERFNTVWASDDAIAGCLASYIHDVSNRHRDRGGNGRVFAVGHSMGGLAIRFALDPRYGGIPDLADRVGGVVTIDTPHTGSMWGDTWVAQVVSQVSDLSQGGVTPTVSASLPAIESRAWVCLKGGPVATWKGCAEPPPLPKAVRLQQIVGQVAVRRTMFGVEAYTMHLGGDGIVQSESQWGGGGSNHQISCTVNAADLIGANPFQPVIFMLADNAAMDIFSGALAANPAAPMLALEPVLKGLYFAGCSHLGVTKDDEALQAVDEALTEQAAYTGLTGVGPLRARAPVPASCDNPAAVAKQGRTDFGNSGGGWLSLTGDEHTAGPVFGDLTGDGLKDAAVVYNCTAGGVSWTDWVLVYSTGPELVGAYDFADSRSAQQHASISTMRVADGGVDVQWVSYTGAGNNPLHFQGRLQMVDGDLQLVDSAPRTPDVEVGPGFVGPLYVGATAQELAADGLVEPATDDMCGVSWENTYRPELLWTEFRDGDPDDLDGIAVTDSSGNLATGEVVTTAEGAGVGTAIETLQQMYGDRLDYGHFEGEGEYDAFVLFGTDGALMFVVSAEDIGPDYVAAMYAVPGTSMSDLQHWIGGC